MNLDTKLGDLSTAIARTLHDTFKREIRAKLQAAADQVVDEVAEELAKDLVLKVDHMISNDAYGPEVRVLLRVNDVEKQYGIEKKVIERPMPQPPVY